VDEIPDFNIKNKILSLQEEAQALVEEKENAQARALEIDTRLTQIVGAMLALHDLIRK
jgi:hypothetical protein